MPNGSEASIGKLLFYRTLRTAAAAGVDAKLGLETLLEACAPEWLFSDALLFRLLDVCAGQKMPPMSIRRQTLLNVSAKLRQGAAFSDALSRYHEEFQTWELALIKVGERTGRMDEAFGRLADIIEARRSALMRVAAASAQPFITRMLIPAIVCVPLAYFFGIRIYLGVVAAAYLLLTPVGKLIFSSGKTGAFDPQTLPGFSRMQFLYVLAALIGAGLGPDEAVGAAAGAAGKPAPAASAPGETLCDRVARVGILSQEELGMIRVLETSGALDKGLAGMAERAARSWAELNAGSGTVRILTDGV